MLVRRHILAIASAGAMLCGDVGFEAAAANYGCYKVTAESLHIRERPYSDSKVLSTATKGDILEKRKLICTPRGFWCAVRAGGIDGYADKNFMVKVACP